MTTSIDSSILTAFGITTADLDNQLRESPSPGTGLMNPREYEDLLKKLRHLRVQELNAEKNLTEARIEKAALIKENIDRADYGQKQGIYDAAGVDRTEVQKDIRVGNMLGKGGLTHDLPNHSTLQIIAADSVPQHVRDKVLANPAMTQKEVRAVVKAVKGASPPVRKKVDPYDLMAQAQQLDRVGAILVHRALSRQLGDEVEAYATLGLLASATMTVVKAVHRALQSEHHPDKGGDPVRFQKVQAAYEIIMKSFAAQEAKVTAQVVTAKATARAEADAFIASLSFD